MLTNLLLLAVLNISPAILCFHNIRRPIGARDNRGDGGSDHHALHPSFLRRRKHVHGPFNCWVQKLLLHENNPTQEFLQNQNGVYWKVEKFETFLNKEEYYLIIVIPEGHGLGRQCRGKLGGTRRRSRGVRRGWCRIGGDRSGRGGDG